MVKTLKEMNGACYFSYDADCRETATLCLDLFLVTSLTLQLAVEMGEKLP